MYNKSDPSAKTKQKGLLSLFFLIQNSITRKLTSQFTNINIVNPKYLSQFAEISKKIMKLTKCT